MKFAGLAVLCCLTAGLASGCVSIGNQGINAIQAQELAEIRAELDAEMQEMQGEYQDAMTEVQLVLDEVRDELRAEFEDPAWIGELVLGTDDSQERPRRVIWQKGMASEEVEDREAFIENLHLADWKYSEESTNGLEEKASYTVGLKESIGLLDGWNKEYVDVARIVAYEGSNLVAVEINVTENAAGMLTKSVVGALLGTSMDEWVLTFAYEVPEDVVAALRSLEVVR